MQTVLAMRARELANRRSSWSVAQCLAIALLIGMIATAVAPSARAQSDGSTPTESDELALDQSKIADRYERVEKLILRMAEFDQASNPRRADLLKKAFAMGKERDIQLQLEAVARLLNQDKYKRAIDGQSQARKDLQSLLELLLSENRSDRLKDEQARVRDYIREIERLERMQRSVQARTEGGVDAAQAKKEQERVADRTESLQRRIEENETSAAEFEDDETLPNASDAAQDRADEPQAGQPGAGDPSRENGKPSDGTEGGESEQAEKESDAARKPQRRDNPLRPKKPPTEENDQAPDAPQSQPGEGEGQPQEGAESQPSESQPSESQPSESQPSESQPSESQPGQPQPGPPSQGQPSQGQPGNSEGQPQEQQPQQQQDFPGRQRIEEAERHMREAEQKLAEAQREGAIEEQQEAAKKLAEAKAELEEILRQMREEEIERVLAALEVRFRRMLEMQLRVYEDTLRVDRIPAESRDRLVEIEAGKLSFQEKRIVVEADKCLNLLREEGSSVAFPESVQQMRDDMQLVTDRLAKSQVGRFTQGIEEDIIEALEEMLEALEKAQADQEERKQQPGQPSQGGTPGDMPLVDAIAELKMLKALQMRINRRTTRYATLLDDADDPVGRANDQELLLSIQNLAERQERLHEITRDISLGKNK